MQLASTPHAKMRLHLIAIPILLTIHNIEEVVGGMGATREAMRGRLPEVLGSLAGSHNSWLVAVVAVTVIPWLLLLLGGLDRRDSGVARALVVLQAGMSLNVLSHVGGTIVTGAYTGGRRDRPPAVRAVLAAVLPAGVARGMGESAGAALVAGPGAAARAPAACPAGPWFGYHRVSH